MNVKSCRFCNVTKTKPDICVSAHVSILLRAISQQRMSTWTQLQATCIMYSRILYSVCPLYIPLPLKIPPGTQSAGGLPTELRTPQVDSLCYKETSLHAFCQKTTSSGGSHVKCGSCKAGAVGYGLHQKANDLLQHFLHLAVLCMHLHSCHLLCQLLQYRR